MKRAARNVDNYLSTASLKFFIINRYESDLVSVVLSELQSNLNLEYYLNDMKKIIFTAIIHVFWAANTFGELYKAKTMLEIQDMAEDILAKRDPEKVLFAFPLERFILQPSMPAMQKQDDDYRSLLGKAFGKLGKKNKKNMYYTKELMLLEYPYEITDAAVINLVTYIQHKKAGIIITTPNVTGGINEVDNFELWTVNYLKRKKIDLTVGKFAKMKFSLKKISQKTKGSYPGFYQGLLSCNTDGTKNSLIQIFSGLIATKLRSYQNVVVVIADNQEYLINLEKQLKVLQTGSEFFGIIYDMPVKTPRSKEISPEAYLQFWQNFAAKLPKVKRTNITNKLPENGPYDEDA